VIKCLKDEGIYVWLDLHVAAQFPSRAMALPISTRSDSKGKPTADLKGFNYVNASIQEAIAAVLTKPM